MLKDDSGSLPTPPRCPNCGREMMDDSDGITGGWLCAHNHRAVIIDIEDPEPRAAPPAQPSVPEPAGQPSVPAGEGEQK
jgi:hypothetical protein